MLASTFAAVLVAEVEEVYGSVAMPGITARCVLWERNKKEGGA